MGFFSDLGKAIIGQPVGQSSQSMPEQQNESRQTSTPQQGIHDERGIKIIPTIGFKNLRSQPQGNDRMIVKAFIVNESDQPLRIDTSRLLGQTKTHNQLLGPRDAREITLYDGKMPDNENERNAQIAYRLQVNGDVFMENYRIKYDLESDGKRTIGDLIDDGPVRDI